MMATLYEILAEAQGGEAIAVLGREFGLTPQQTQGAVMALLPAISMGLKQATATPEGLGNLFGVMGHQRDLHAMYGDPKIALAPEGRAAGNDVLSVIFGSPDVSRAVVDQAQQFSGVGSSILKKMLPVIVGMLISGLMGNKSGKAAPQSPAAPTGAGGGLGDILGQIFGRGMPGSPGPSPGAGQQLPIPRSQPTPVPGDTSGQSAPSGDGGDLLGQILREFEKGIREGRIKPVIIGGGPVQVPMPDSQPGSTPDVPNQPQGPGGDVLGKVLRDIFGQAMGGPAQMPQGQQGQSPQLKDLSDLSKKLGVMGGAGAAVFGDRFEVGRDVEKRHLENIQSVFDQFFGPQRR
jgi:hypothetical protein